MMLTMFIRIHAIPNNTHEIYDIHRIHSRVPSPVWFLLLVIGHPWGIGSKNVIFGAASCGSRLSLYCLRSGKTMFGRTRRDQDPQHMHYIRQLIFYWFTFPLHYMEHASTTFEKMLPAIGGKLG